MGKKRVTTYKGGKFDSTTGADESTESRTKEALTNFRLPTKPEAEKPEPAKVTPTPLPNAVATPITTVTSPRGQIPEWMKKKK